MLFNSYQFLIFFCVMFALYFATRGWLRMLLLLAGSYFFYAFARVEYLALLILITLCAYGTGRLLERTSTPGRRRALLLLGVGATSIALIVFKYSGFFDVIFNDLLNVFGQGYASAGWQWLIPVGLSFYTFQAVGYVVDVYRKDMPAEHNLLIFALYLSFFPQLVAGPIERAANLLPQFRQDVRFDYDRAMSGIQLMLWGFFKKLVIADKLGLTVDWIYNSPQEHVGIPLLVATYFFTFQIYCDFSGYSDIAIGCARILGIDLMDNFNRPYLARSMGDFWRRWHISLYSWFRDYIYIPLGGRMSSALLTYRNVIIVFLVTGLWHGANYTFLLWGLGHGVALIASRSLSPAWRRLLDAIHIGRDSRLGKIVNWFVTFQAVSLLWVLFRANSVKDAWYVYSHMFINLWPVSFKPIRGDVPLMLILSLMVVEFFMRRYPPSLVLPQQIFRLPSVRWLTASVVFLFVVFLGEYDNHQFIYFVF